MQVVSALKGAEAALWKEALQQATEETFKTSPTTPVLDVYMNALRAFQRDHWMLTIGEKKRLPREEYHAMDAGPDLTLIPRTRYGKVKGSRTGKGPNKYNNYVKEMSRLHADEWKELSMTDRMKQISASWKELTPVEREAYAGQTNE